MVYNVFHIITRVQDRYFINTSSTKLSFMLLQNLNSEFCRLIVNAFLTYIKPLFQKKTVITSL